MKYLNLTGIVIILSILLTNCGVRTIETPIDCLTYPDDLSSSTIDKDYTVYDLILVDNSEQSDADIDALDSIFFDDSGIINDIYIEPPDILYDDGSFDSEYESDVILCKDESTYDIQNQCSSGDDTGYTGININRNIKLASASFYYVMAQREDRIYVVGFYAYDNYIVGDLFILNMDGEIVLSSGGNTLYPPVVDDEGNLYLIGYLSINKFDKNGKLLGYAPLDGSTEIDKWFTMIPFAIDYENRPVISYHTKDPDRSWIAKIRVMRLPNEDTEYEWKIPLESRYPLKVIVDTDNNIIFLGEYDLEGREKTLVAKISGNGEIIRQRWFENTYYNIVGGRDIYILYNGTPAKIIVLDKDLNTITERRMKSYSSIEGNLVVDERNNIVYIYNSPYSTYINYIDLCGGNDITKIEKDFSGSYPVLLSDGTFLISGSGYKNKEPYGKILRFDKNLNKVGEFKFEEVDSFSLLYIPDCKNIVGLSDEFDEFDDASVVFGEFLGVGLRRSPWPMWRGDTGNTSRVQKW